MQLNDQEMREKLIILYVLDKMEVPLTADNLTELCTIDNEWLDYFTLTNGLHTLMDSGFLAEAGEINKKTAYTVTPDGRVCLSYFSTRIPASIRDEILNVVNERRLHYKKTQEYYSDYAKNDDGTYTVTMRIDNPQNLMEIKLVTDTKQNAEHFVKEWYDKASTVYEALYDTLME